MSRTVKVRDDELVVSQSYVNQLLAVKDGHDAYLWAVKRMADRVRETERTHTTSHGQVWVQGYRSALDDFARLVVDAPSGGQA